MNKQESRYRWVVFGTVLVAYFIMVSQRTAPGLITDQLMKEFQVSASMIGLMSSIQFFAYAGLQIPVGLLSDRFGPNRFLIFGTLLNGVGTLLYSLAPNEYVLILARFLVGTGDATIFVNLILLLSEWFHMREYVGLLGVVSLAASFGSLTSTVPFSMWISAAGWRTPFMSIGLILVVFSYLIYTVLIAKPKRKFPVEQERNPRSMKKRESVWAILRRLVTTRQAWATFFCHFGVVGTYVGFIGSWGVPYGIHVFGLSRSSASQLMMYGLFGAMVGGPFISWLTSRLGKIKNVYSFVHLLVWLSWTGLFFAGAKPPYWLVVVLLLVIGFGNGASSLTFAVVRASFPLEEVGVVSGFANMGGFLSAVLLPSIFGSVLDRFPQAMIAVGYHYGFLIPALFSLLGLVGVLMMRREEKRELAVE